MQCYSIIGAGVAGLSVATALTERGAAVRIYDIHGAPGPHACSWWAGGMLAPWCEYENAEERVLRLGQQAISWWSRYTEVTTCGTLVVANPRDKADIERFARRTHGYERIDRSGITALEPDLAHFHHGLFFPEEAHLNPRQALQDLYHRLEARGVTINTQPAPAQLSSVIDCRGLHARDHLHELRGVKGEMLVICCPEVQLSRPVRLLHPRIPLYIVPRGNGVYMLGATAIETEDSKRITARSMLELLSAAYALHPAFGEAEILEIGVDLRPAFTDNLPQIQRIDDTIYCNGLYRHGYLLAPALAEATADWILDGKPSEMTHENHNKR